MGVARTTFRGAPIAPRAWSQSAGRRSGVARRAADVAATVLDLLGLAVDGLDGSSLVTSAGGHRMVDAPVAVHSDDGYSADEEAAVLEHLKGLGYVD